jgi:lipopolysaccharide/colanic/teichoic acid biosynthesis glycosyltransferase
MSSHSRVEEVQSLVLSSTTPERESQPPAYSMPLGRARAKDALDVTLSIVALVFLTPLMLIVAIAIKLDSRGPVLFVQERSGVRRRRVGRWMVHEPAQFRFYKFRSMVADADPSLHEAHIQKYVNGDGLNGSKHARFKLADDPRITRVGRLIRRTSIDELPQLFNVLKREMSLVGPRPVPPYEGRHYLERFPERFAALPGITGLWQVSGRCDLSSEEMTELDLEYIRTQSLGLDAKILLRTIPVVLTARGAG